MTREMKQYTLYELPQIKVHGRTTEARMPLTLFWTGSGIELHVTGNELAIEVESDYENYEQWLSIWINDAEISRLMLPKGKQWLTIFRGMSEDTIKRVRLYKDTQAMSGDEHSLLQIHSIKSNGKFHPVPNRPHRIEFIGDSITSGEGGVGAVEDYDWISMYFSSTNNYARLTAEALYADYRVVSQSGWGVYCSWDNNPNFSIPQYYEQVCGLLHGERNIQLGAHEPYSFDRWQPEIVVVNLGTNDCSAFYQPGWLDEQTGITYQQRLLEDGRMHPDDLVLVEQAAIKFLKTIRKCNPQAQIVWVYGMLGANLMPVIYRAVNRYIEDSQDCKVTVMQLPNMNQTTVGSRAHPGPLAHQKSAEELTTYLRQFLYS